MPSSKEIFISHAAVDSEIASKVIDLINVMGLDAQNRVFCSSLQGMGIPPGENFKDFIKSQIQEPRIVFLLISQNYVESAFCLAEVGAAWAMSHRVIPIIVPPSGFDQMKAVLQGTQAFEILNAAGWNEVLDIMTHEFGLSPNRNYWERKRDEILGTLPALIKKQPKPKVIDSAKHEATVKQLNDANKEITGFELELKRMKSLIAQLEAAKDAQQVHEIKFAAMSENEKLKTLAGRAKTALGKLLRPTRDALFYSFRGEQMLWPDAGFRDEIEAINVAREHNQLLDYDDNALEPNSDEPKVSAAEDALRDLQLFISRVGTSYKEAYAKEYDHALSFKSREFWNEWL